MSTHAISCTVAHTDADGNAIPCPNANAYADGYADGYAHGISVAKSHAVTFTHSDPEPDTSGNHHDEHR